MASPHTIAICITQEADCQLVASFVEEMGHTPRATASFDELSADLSDGITFDMLIVDEHNTQEFSDQILQLKLKEGAAYLPIVSILPATASVARWLQRGYDDVLRIPITRLEFQARVEAFLRLREASEQRFQSIFEDTPIGIFRMTPSGELLLANPALVSMLKFKSQDELLKASEERKGMTPVSLQEKHLGESVWRRKDGSSLPVLIRSTVRRDKEGHPLYVEGTVEDLTERKQIETVLRDHAARLTIAMDAASMGDVDIHFNDGTVVCAQMVYRLFGFESEPENKSLVYLAKRVHPNDMWALRRAVEESVAKGRTLSAEFRVRMPHNEERWLRLRGEVMFDDNQRPERMVGVIRDATEEKRLQLDLIRAKLEAEELASLKSTFLANMSHEIRTPLTAIIGFASLLSGRVADEQKPAVRRIQEGGQRLLETLNAILTLARLESGRMDLVLEETDVLKEVTGTLGMFENIAAEKGIALTLDAPSKPIRTTIDRGALASILQNLISNAIKFTDKGAVSVAVSRNRGGGKRRPSYSISITDTGEGIDEKFLPHIFDEFKQESSGMRRVHEGAGLGLAIVRRLCELLGGEISVESRKGLGSTFTVTFPEQTSRPSRSKGDEKEDANDDVPHTIPRLLIVEDNEDTKSLLNELLSDRFQVAVASDAKEALALADNDEFDVVLMDINLGEGMTGVDVVDTLRQTDRFRNTPIVALTAYALPGDRERFLSHGFTTHLPKPFDPQVLVDLIQSFD
jgi:PAS domain S-box-containing protein